MPATITVLCYVTEYHKNSAQNLSIADTSGIIRSRSLDSSLKIFLKGFYLQNASQKLSLPPFEKEDVLLVTEKFCTIDHIDESNPNNVPSFLILINMTTVVKDPPVISDDKDVTIAAPHLMRITEIIKKNSILYINGELILYDDTNYVHVKSLSFPDMQKKEPKISAKPPWESESSDRSDRPSVAKTIATRVKNNARQNKEQTSSTTNSYPRLIIVKR
ncbi:11446_t:CDS:2 [Dentiscutata heterogama]|uniref:11446_t:CDS:1 n=1 Tax=Dentiscutata heterogama TaxID=1316150 RepID=A0ACA9KS18_9GLOM|nr:11446_t:CDS:2 [Dentiscutata heterogama]